MAKGLPVISSRRVCERILEDLFDSVNEGDVSIPLANAWGGLDDAMTFIGFAMRETPRNMPQHERYKKAIELARRRRARG